MLTVKEFNGSMKPTVSLDFQNKIKRVKVMKSSGTNCSVGAQINLIKSQTDIKFFLCDENNEILLLCSPNIIITDIIYN